MVRDDVAARLLRVLFAAYVAATALHIGWVMAHEPFAFDAWNVTVATRGAPFSLGRFLDFGIYEYTHSNPRIGQWLTYLAYKLTWFAPIATPLAYLALAGAITVLGLGRWPRTGRDLALAAVAIGAAWFALPHLGMVMFCRAYGANYLYGAAIQLWFLVPLRLALAGPAAAAGGPGGDTAPRAWIPYAYGVLGVLAGMCNEHTGPALVAGLTGLALWRRRTTGRHPALVWAGAAGAAIGFALIFFAPGQASRYEGLATKVSLLGRLIQRGATGNLDILGDWVIACAPVLALIVVALALARRDEPARVLAPLRWVGLALAAGTAIAVTLFVSPKLGPRFYLHGAALLLAGFLAVADHTLITARRLVPFVVLAVAASVYAGARSVPLYHRLDAASAARLAQLAAAPRGGVFTAEAFEQVGESWWFLGDDFRDSRKRDLVAGYFGLSGVILRAVDIDAPLGVSDVRLVPRYQVTPAGCLDEHGGLELGSFRGIDVASLHRAARAAIERMRDRLAAAGRPGRLDRLDLVVEFAGAPPPLPRPTLLVARWTPAGFEAPAGAIDRKGRSTVRRVRLPAELRGGDAEVYIFHVDGEARRLGTARDAVLEYVPWRRGAYWALACRPSECFVIAAARLL